MQCGVELNADNFEDGRLRFPESLFKVPESTYFRRRKRNICTIFS